MISLNKWHYRCVLTLGRLFVEHQTWRDSAMKYCKMFTWGGKTEQEIARRLRENNKADIDR
jgi:hypothetical protein